MYVLPQELEPPSDKSEGTRDPRLDDEHLMQRIGTEERKKRVTLVEDTGGSAADLEVRKTLCTKETKKK